MQKFIVIGNLTRDVELATTNNGKTVAKFSVAVKRNYKNKDGEYDSDFFNCIAYGGLADTCGKYLSKGRKCSIIGRVQIDSYEKDGQKRYSTNIIVEELEFLSTPKSTNDSAVDPATPELTPIDPDEGLPF